ncbi:MAG: DUF2059 domain-containing protein [Deltaproteobacteria bacterium]|nr:DUF2059 domain-containing protein [Deltaproteobacteria bacterium]
MKRKWFIFLPVIAAFVFCTLLPAMAQTTVSPEKRTEILKLMKLTNGAKLANEMKARIIKALKESFPDAPAEYWKKLDKRIDVRELLDSFVTIYAENLSLEDLKQLVAFYKTPAGQHYLAAKERMVAASAERGKKWAMGWIIQVFKELKAQGYKPKSGKAPGKTAPKGKKGIDKSPNS